MQFLFQVKHKFVLCDVGVFSVQGAMEFSMNSKLSRGKEMGSVCFIKPSDQIFIDNVSFFERNNKHEW